MKNLLLAALVALVGCSAESSPEPTDAVRSAKIIGDNDLTPVVEDGANLPDKYRSLVDAFGRMSMGCTATHIGNGVALTAGHCFRAPTTRTNDLPCPNVRVEWGYRADSDAYLTSTCTTVYAAQYHADIDYAIFQVDVAPTAKVEVDLTARPALGTAITIFSHPRRRPLEWSKTCLVAARDELSKFSHQCDTEPASSGATVLDDETLKVVGIHDGGVVPWNYATYLADTPLAEMLTARAQERNEAR